MLDAVIVTTDTGKQLVMELRDPEKSGFLVRNISGIGAGETDLKLTELAALPGSTYGGSRKPTRNIVFDLILLWASSVEEARHKCDEYFPIGELITLYFLDSTTHRNCYIKGVVESNTPDIFNTEQLDGIPCTISVLCSDPRFIDINSTVWESVTTQSGGYIFPANRTKPTGIVTGKSVWLHIVYSGTRHEGLQFIFEFKNGTPIHRIRIRAVQPSNNYSDLILQLPRNSEQSDTWFKNGDKLIIDTNQGSKSIILYRNSTEFNYMNYLLSMQTTWPYLTPGNNSFNLVVNGNEGAAVAYTVSASYTKAYWSV